MIYNSRLLLATLLLMAFLSPSVRGASPEEIDNAIKKAEAYLFAQQTNGDWEAGQGANPMPAGGLTALVTHALLVYGESPLDNRMANAENFLKHCPMQSVQAISLCCQVWQSQQKPYKPDILLATQNDATALMQATDPIINPRQWNPTNAAYGVWGVSACERVAGVNGGVQNFWPNMDAAWRNRQAIDGSWDNGPNGHTVAVTCAGLASLFAANDVLHRLDGVTCVGNITDLNIESALKWLDLNFNQVLNKGDPYYALYAVEGVARASGRKYFGQVDWFKYGAEFLVKKQGPQGQWNSTADTCYGLLFLVRGRAPVVINKLQYDIDMHGNAPKVANWNQRPRDAANITQWMGTQLCNPLFNWQTVHLKMPVEDLHDAPILYLAGNQSLDFTNAELAKLQQFVEEGGVIFANADCGSIVFFKAVRKMAHKIFPAYEFRDLPADSPIYVHEMFWRNKWHSRPHVEVLSNGARELIVLIPADTAQYWQTRTIGGHEEMHELMDDIFLYSIDRGSDGGLQTQGQTYLVKSDPNIHTDKTLKVARLQYPGNWDPEPAGWRRLGAILHNTQKIDLDVQTINLGDGKLDNSYKVAHLTGTYKFSLVPAAHDEIKKFVAGGGTLIIDACGGNSEFAKSAEEELAAIFPAAPLPAAPLSPDDAVYALGPTLERVRYRSFARGILGNLQTARIRSMAIDGRPAVFYSGEDLSCGIVGLQTDGIYGYDPASATALMEKLVLFAGK